MSNPNESDMSLKVTEYSSQSGLRNPISMIHELLSDVLASRDLAWRLASRDISAQYRQTILGILWAFILPITQTVAWVFLSNSGIVTLQDTGIPYPVYVFTGTLLWQILTESVFAPLNETNNAKGMLTKLKFPKEALILSGILKTLFNSSIKVFLVVIALFFFGIDLSWTLLYLPIGILTLILTGTTIGLLVTPVGVLYTDIHKLLPLVFQFLMYVSPVVFAMPTSGIAAIVFKLNPLSYLITTTRSWITGTEVMFFQEFMIVNAIFFALFIISTLIYKLAMPILVERMSS